MNDNLSFGFFDASILELLDRSPQFVESHDAVITCIDSGENTASSIANIVSPDSLVTLGKFAVLPGEVILRHKAQIFTGFDELYVFSREGWREIEPSVWKTHFTSDTTELRDSIPNDLRQAFIASRAIRYASDGCGLNVIATDPNELAVLRTILALQR